MFAINTNAEAPKATPRAYDGKIDFSGHPDHAIRKAKQIIAQIEACESSQEVTDTLTEHELVIDALFLSSPELSDQISEASEGQHAILSHGNDCANDTGAPVAITPTAQSTAKESKGTRMFNINTSTGGESGPFLNFKNRAGVGMGDGTWYLRSKDGDEWHYEDMTSRFNQGFVADVYATHDGQLGGSLAMGFIKFNEGSAPERHIWASPMAQEKRRSEEKTATGGMAWQNLVNFRVAIGGGESALFDVNGWSGYKGVMALIEQMNAGFAENMGKAPMVIYKGFRVEGSGQKRLHVPEFEITQWVDVPDCLKPDAPSIATNATPAETPAPAAVAAAQTPVASGAPAGGTF